MGKFSKHISEKRRSIETPKSIVNEDGRVVFGTFNKEFEDMDLLKAKKPTKVPSFLNKLRLTLWEACEVHVKDGILLAAASDMAVLGKILILYYDKTTKELYQWDITTRSKKAIIAKNLLNGNETKCQTRNGHVKFINNFESGRASLHGKYSNSNGTIEFDFMLNRLSDPCVVSIPFGENRPLYSQKDFFKAVGNLKINGKEIEVDEKATAIIDDHRGYYPRRAHYDWLSTMGKFNFDKDEEYLAFNLTRNQSINQEDYNENILWKEGKSSLLPPITFDKNNSLREFKEGTEWIVKDEHDMVNVKYKIYNRFAMLVNVVFVKIEYYVTFGELEGYIRDENGKKYNLDNIAAIGEDKTLLF